MGDQEGFGFTFNGKIGNTRDSHRLSHLGRELGGYELEDKVQMAMMKMFFEEGGDITSYEDLVAAAEKVGIERDVARKWLEDGSGGEDVDREVEEMEKLGMKGVPKILVDGKFAIEGADDVTAMFEQLYKAKEEKEKEDKSSV